jgi:hypothetical protein
VTVRQWDHGNATGLARPGCKGAAASDSSAASPEPLSFQPAARPSFWVALAFRAASRLISGGIARCGCDRAAWAAPARSCLCHTRRIRKSEPADRLERSQECVNTARTRGASGCCIPDISVTLGTVPILPNLHNEWRRQRFLAPDVAPFAFEKDGPGLACGARGIGRDHALMAPRASQSYQSDEQTLA